MFRVFNFYINLKEEENGIEGVYILVGGSRQQRRKFCKKE